MTNLMVPYALDDDGEAVSPEQADGDTAYFCPECQELVIVRRGAVTVAHFAHIGESKNCDFAGEGRTHLLAKHSVYWAILCWIRHERKSPLLSRKCEFCGEDLLQNLPEQLDEVRIEHRVGTFRCDVCVLSKGTAWAAFEIVSSNTMPTEKINAFKALDFPWVEIEARDIMLDLVALYPWPVERWGGLLNTCPCREVKKPKPEPRLPAPTKQTKSLLSHRVSTVVLCPFTRVQTISPVSLSRCSRCRCFHSVLPSINRVLCKACSRPVTIRIVGEL